MKSLANELLRVASKLLLDAKRAYPADWCGLDKDLLRLTQLVKHRGLGIFTLDLPSFDSQLLSGLESGRLIVEGTAMYSKRCKVPRLFSGLYLRVFDKEGCLRADADPTAIAFLRQLLGLGKKIEVPCSKVRKYKAIKEYLHVESATRKPTLSWSSDSLRLNRKRLEIHLEDAYVPDLPLFPDKEVGKRGDGLRLLNKCQQVADFIVKSLGHYSPDAILDSRQDIAGRPLGLKHGPGAIADPEGSRKDKFDFSRWSAKLNRLYPFQYFGRMPNDSSRSVLNHEVPARMLCVPKTAKSPRIIAAEPSEHMFCQMLLKSFLEEKIKDNVLGTFINFKRQDLSAELVKSASLDRSLATIDLSSASDRLSCWLVERIFRSNPSILDAIHASRTRWLYIPELQEYIELKKFASQGTAITFPVQTIVFTIIALAVSLGSKRVTLHNLYRLRNQVRVYGDDIIVPSTAYAGVTTLLHDLGLKVNQDKSFVKGHFRESCGMDSFRGYDVTPVKPKRISPDGPASCLSVLDTSNNLFYKGYWNASEYFKNRLRSNPVSRFPVVGRDAGTQGFGSYSAQLVAARGDIGLVRCHKTLRRFVCKYEPTFREMGIYRFRFHPRWQRVEFLSTTIRSRRKVRPYHSGYSGLLQLALANRDPNSLNCRAGSPGVPLRSTGSLRS